LRTSSILLFPLILVCMLLAASAWCVGPALPDGVVEVTGRGFVSLVELKDGSLLANSGQSSADGGKTWSAPRSFGDGISGENIVRLKSGALALGYGGYWTSPGRLWTSADEGKTWSAVGQTKLLGIPLIATLVVAGNGNLIWPSRDCFGNMWQPELEYLSASAWGTYKGKKHQMEGHGHIPEVSIAAVSVSKDEGKSWQIGRGDGDWSNATAGKYSSATLMGFFGPDGLPTKDPESGGWITDCDEPTAAECKDGRILLFGRSTCGRIVASYSSDGGVTFGALRPTEICNSYSPVRIVRIPTTGDLLCVWNQISAEEIRRGFRRGRMSVAISQDNGKTWSHFKTIEQSGGLKSATYIKPEYPIKMLIRARKDVGALPEDWRTFDYPCVSFVGDKAFIMYERASLEAGNAEMPQTKGENVLRIYPIDYFYSGSEKPVVEMFKDRKRN
jgi:hypothetical protein